MISLRTPEMIRKYEKHQKTGALLKSCAICDGKPIKAFRYWKIINNNFPYDVIARVHHMVVPLRHTKERDLKAEEIEELLQIKEEVLCQEYDYLIEASTKNKSIPNHFHIHLIVTKD